MAKLNFEKNKHELSITKLDMRKIKHGKARLLKKKISLTSLHFQKIRKIYLIKLKVLSMAFFLLNLTFIQDLY